MPRLSLYTSTKSNNYRYFDRLVREQLYAGGTDLYIHKYVGPAIKKSKDELDFPDATQPEYNTSNILEIQDLLFLETRDRKYDKDIYCLRGHYQVQSLDFDLSQFGLFLSNDIVFISVHYNDMIETFGRKLMVGDVIELPHLTDYHPLDETIPVSLRRFYQVTDGSFASEGYSPTWYPHIWRIKCEPLVDSREFSEILDKPVNEDSYLGEWNSTDTYVSGYVVKYGDKLYTPKVDNVPANIPCTNEDYWELSAIETIRSTLSTYKKNLEINQASIDEAFNQTPKSGFDRTQIFLVATENGIPASQDEIIIADGPPDPFAQATVLNSSSGSSLQLSAAALNKVAISFGINNVADIFKTQFSFKIGQFSPERLSTNSGQVSGNKCLLLASSGQVNINQNRDSDQTVIARTTPSGFGMFDYVLSGDENAPNGIEAGSGTQFPQNSTKGDYFLRIDFFPQKMFRFDGKLWKQISENVRTGVGFTTADKSLRSSFINNSNQTELSNGTMISERQALTKIFKIKPD